jgi:tRNA-intron endonuclease
MIELEFGPKKGIWVEDEESLEKLRRNYFGKELNGKLFLTPEEALYLINFQNGVCRYKDKALGFDDIASYFIKEDPRLFIKYNAFRDWRDRGLIIRRVEGRISGKSKTLKHYPAVKFKPEKIDAKVFWHPSSLFSIMEDKKTAKKLFEDLWLGQYGIYKQRRGNLLKLDFLETVFLAKHFGVKIVNIKTGKKESHVDVLKEIVKKREYTKQLYDVYEDWRLAGFVVKTGFKFGSHFRIYFPGASPVRQDKWLHSKHVLHVFPKEQKMLISEWARVVRVAHSVKKTFILAIPKLEEKDYVDYPAPFVAYRRKKQGKQLVRETPEDPPRYLVACVSEDEHIGGLELASLLKKANDMNTELLLSITDRETSVTYYLLKRVILPNSKYEYYEIEWFKP